MFRGSFPRGGPSENWLADLIDMDARWLIPDWPVPAGVRAVFTTRAGGLSETPYDSLNLGDHVGDLPAKVAANRALLRQALGRRAVFLQQVHGSEVLALDAGTDDGLQADACVAKDADVACIIMVADCLPVLLTTDDGAMVAAAHAGWRGLAGQGGQGVLETVHAAMKADARTLAWLGPCIGPSAFEVGPEVKAAFEVVQPDATELFVPTGAGKYLADLPGLARLRLKALGVTQVYGNDGSDAWCTVRNPSRFFSHRRDAGPTGNGFGTTGRMAACIWRS
jgi:YfiH family protein